MTLSRWLLALPVLLVIVAAAPADDTKDEAGFVPMFNGHDLTGWVNVNCAPSTFYVKDGEIITTGHPTGYLRTTRQYENFIAEFDWMHVPPKPGAVGNSGFFVWADPIPAVGTGYTRGIEVQVLVNLTYRNKKGEITATSQGDLFSIHGATCVPDRPHPDGWARCLPSGNYCKGEREWNHYRVRGDNGSITLVVNGHAVSGVSRCNPRKGYLALESEGSECHFRNLKIMELPSTHEEGFKNLYTGLDLSGWKADDETKKHWQPRDTVLHYDGKGKELRTEKEYGDAEFIVDFRFPPGGGKRCTFLLHQAKDGQVWLSLDADGNLKTEYLYADSSGGNTSDKIRALNPAGRWNRLRVLFKPVSGDLSLAFVNGKRVGNWFFYKFKKTKSTFAIRPEGEMDFANLFVRELK